MFHNNFRDDRDIGNTEWIVSINRN